MRKVQIIPNYFVTADVRNRSSVGLVRFVALRKNRVIGPATLN